MKATFQWFGAFPKRYPMIFGIILGVLLVMTGLGGWIIFFLFDGTFVGDAIQSAELYISEHQVKERTLLEKILPGGN